MLDFLDEAWKRADHTTSLFQWTAPELALLHDKLQLLCRAARKALRQGLYPTVHVRSPVLVLGDLHGSFDDLNFFLKQLYDPDNPGDLPMSPASAKRAQRFRIAANAVMLSDDGEQDVSPMADLEGTMSLSSSNLALLREASQAFRLPTKTKKLLFLGSRRLPLRFPRFCFAKNMTPHHPPPLPPPPSPRTQRSRGPGKIPPPSPCERNALVRATAAAVSAPFGLGSSGLSTATKPKRGRGLAGTRATGGTAPRRDARRRVEQVQGARQGRHEGPRSAAPRRWADSGPWGSPGRHRQQRPRPMWGRGERRRPPGRRRPQTRARAGPAAKAPQPLARLAPDAPGGRRREVAHGLRPVLPLGYPACPQRAGPKWADLFLQLLGPWTLAVPVSWWSMKIQFFL